MVAFGISALVIGIVGIFIPFAGVFLSGLSGVLAIFSAGKGTTLGASATIINLINILFLSPSLIISASSKLSVSGAHAANSKTIFGVLITIQVIAVLVLIGQKIISKKHSASAA